MTALATAICKSLQRQRTTAKIPTPIFNFFNSSAGVKLWIGGCAKFAKWPQFTRVIYRGAVFFRHPYDPR